MGFTKVIKQLSAIRQARKDRKLNRKVKNRESKVKTAKGYAEAYGKWKQAKEAKYDYRAKTAKANQAGKTVRSLGRSITSMQISKDANNGNNMLATALGQEYKDTRSATGKTGTGTNTTSQENDDTDIATAYERGNRI